MGPWVESNYARPAASDHLRSFSAATLCAYFLAYNIVVGYLSELFPSFPQFICVHSRRLCVR